MLQRLAALLIFIFLATHSLTWPALPYHAHLADFVFVVLAATVLAMPGPWLSWRWADTAVVIYLLGAIPAIAVSPDHRQSVIELARESYVAAIYVLFAIATRRGFSRTIADGLAIGGALLSIAGLIFIVLQKAGAVAWPLMGEVMTLPYVGATVRLRAITDSEAMLACLLTASIPFAIARSRSDRRESWNLMAVVMTIAALFTFSHAIAGVAVAIFIAASPSLKNRPARLAAASVVILIVLAFNFAATVSIRSVVSGNTAYADRSQYHYGVDERTTQIGSTTVSYTVMSYARLKQVAWRTFVESPIAGIGLDQFPVATRRAFNEGRLPELYSEVDPHSTLPGRLAECGMIGGITLVLLWIAWAALAKHAMRIGDGIGIAAAAALAGLIVSSLNADIMNFRFLWVVAGLLRGLYEANGMVTTSGRDTRGGAGTR